jgi:hypothetical protein
MDEFRRIDRLLGIVDFPEAGEGFTLKFRPQDFAKMQSYPGITPKTLMNELAERFDNYDVPFVERCIRIGLKDPSGRPVDGFIFGEFFRTHQETVVDEDGHATEIEVHERIPMKETATAVLDAIYLSLHGKTVSEVLREHAEREAKERVMALAATLPSLASPTAETDS